MRTRNFKRLHCEECEATTNHVYCTGNQWENAGWECCECESFLAVDDGSTYEPECCPSDAAPGL